jgi:hypothetical protein
MYYHIYIYIFDLPIYLDILLYFIYTDQNHIALGAEV